LERRSRSLLRVGHAREDNRARLAEFALWAAVEPDPDGELGRGTLPSMAGPETESQQADSAEETSASTEHQTGSDPSMPKPRFAIEGWLFGGAAFPTEYAPFAL
jgi:hypothetical protein